ncbi:DUF2057 family protein [Marinobacter sp.]|uniref:DUF2057 family protein n=1 Tax=Marinobacter sp. TaxID=50741 RepID=UPI00384EF6FB
MKRVQTWDGEGASPEQVALLKAPGEINVRSVNGRSMGNFLVDDMALDYELQPGRNRVVFTHKTIWGKTTVVRDGESKVDVAVSEPQEVVINARAGEVYRFDLPELENLREARQFAAEPEIQVVNQSGEVVATASSWSPGSNRQAAGALDLSGSGRPEAPTGERLETIDALKLMWERASAEEKREFLRWAFE